MADARGASAISIQSAARKIGDFPEGRLATNGSVNFAASVAVQIPISVNAKIPLIRR